MARKDARNVNPSLSRDARDKLLAALNWPHGKFTDSITFKKAPIYFTACLDWYERLSASDQELCRTLADVIAGAHRDAAEGMAASLPPAPRNPL
jgi:hypothetical protein